MSTQVAVSIISPIIQKLGTRFLCLLTEENWNFRFFFVGVYISNLIFGDINSCYTLFGDPHSAFHVHSYAFLFSNPTSAILTSAS